MEEQIGDVKTGLAEEFIINNLKTSLRSSQMASLQPDDLSRCSQEAEACIICQVLCHLWSSSTCDQAVPLIIHNEENKHVLFYILMITSFQVEYADDEIIGTLDCGHKYHGECIKQWLLVKNLCPICKKAALATDNNQG